MKWRVIEDDHAHTPLPGPAGELCIALSGEQVAVMFRTADTMATMFAEDVSVSSGRVTVTNAGTRVVYVPAKGTKRRRVPVPSFDKPAEVTAGHGDNRLIHRVDRVDKVPDPNREWNRDDALIEAKCGYRSWIRPDSMKATPGVARCTKCDPLVSDRTED